MEAVEIERLISRRFRRNPRPRRRQQPLCGHGYFQ